jgi:hypothetical protein
MPRDLFQYYIKMLSLMERAVFGTHHSISEAHLPRYLSEWD